MSNETPDQPAPTEQGLPQDAAPSLPEGKDLAGIEDAARIENCLRELRGALSGDPLFARAPRSYYQLSGGLAIAGHFTAFLVHLLGEPDLAGSSGYLIGKALAFITVTLWILSIFFLWRIATIRAGAKEERLRGIPRDVRAGFTESSAEGMLARLHARFHGCSEVFSIAWRHDDEILRGAQDALRMEATATRARVASLVSKLEGVGTLPLLFGFAASAAKVFEGRPSLEDRVSWLFLPTLFLIIFSLDTLEHVRRLEYLNRFLDIAMGLKSKGRL